MLFSPFIFVPSKRNSKVYLQIALCEKLFLPNATAWFIQSHIDLNLRLIKRINLFFLAKEEEEKRNKRERQKHGELKRDAPLRLVRPWNDAAIPLPQYINPWLERCGFPSSDVIIGWWCWECEGGTSLYNKIKERENIKIYLTYFALYFCSDLT